MMTTSVVQLTIPMLAILGVIAWTDWHERRIPNTAVLALLLCALVQFVAVRLEFFQGLSSGDVLINVGLFSLLLIPGFLLGIIGAGDIKLFAVLSLLLPPQILLPAFALGITGLVVACFVVDSLTILSYRSLEPVSLDHKVVQQTTGSTLLSQLRTRGIPMGTAIALGTLTSLG